MIRTHFEITSLAAVFVGAGWACDVAPEQGNPGGDAAGGTQAGTTLGGGSADHYDGNSEGAADTADTGSSDATRPTGHDTAGECTDQMILDLGLVSGAVAVGVASSTVVGDDWVSMVDATAGGIVNAPTSPWLYLEFTDDGLRKVELDDLQALGSMDWDIATKRFGIRLNSGVGGPSTVTAAVVDGLAYDEVTDLPDSAALLGESYYDSQCVLIDDGSGLGAPNYVLTPWWLYAACVGTTGTPFVLELSDGARIKFVVDAYYEQGQSMCNSEGAVGTGGARYTWRWAYLAE